MSLPPLHPGEILREEFLKPFALTSYALAKALRGPRTRIERIVREEIGVTADTALRLARTFETFPEFWVGLQAQYELRSAERASAEEIARIRPYDSAA